jgi:DNA-binding GntR family transcriptional regulator
MDTPTATRRSESLREQIEERIITGTYPPGTRLDEMELAGAFGVSRTPIREALIQLEAGGFIERRPRKGWAVCAIPPGRLCEMFDVMAELEAMCARLAARRASDDDHRRIREAHEACEQARLSDDPDAYYRLNEQFHHAIYEASHNAFLVEQAKALHRRLRPYRRLQLRVRNRMATSFDEHGRVVAAILAGDGGQAAEHLRSHVVVQGDRFADLVASIESLTPRRPTAGAARTF